MLLHKNARIDRVINKFSDIVCIGTQILVILL